MASESSKLTDRRIVGRDVDVEEDVEKLDEDEQECSDEEEILSEE
jgi:hypothetical protein